MSISLKIFPNIIQAYFENPCQENIENIKNNLRKQENLKRKKTLKNIPCRIFLGPEQAQRHHEMKDYNYKWFLRHWPHWPSTNSQPKKTVELEKHRLPAWEMFPKRCQFPVSSNPWLSEMLAGRHVPQHRRCHGRSLVRWPSAMGKCSDAKK